MKNKLLLISLAIGLSLNTYATTILTHFSNESEGGVSIEQSVIDYASFKMGAGVSWNEINQKNYNRTFLVYGVGKYELSENCYAVGRLGVTLNEEFYYDSKFIESGIGYELDQFLFELVASHQRGQNQLVLKFGYDL